MITPLIMPIEKNLSIAWAKALVELHKPGLHVRHPAVITINDFDTDAGIENDVIRARLDKFLKLKKQSSCSTVSGTIFPSSMWNRQLPNDVENLFNRYEKAWPGIAKCPANRNGVYFRRLTAYQSKTSTGDEVNQLDKIITTFKKGNHRKSALQGSIFDPTRDHSNQKQRGFPCLQQVTFTPLGNTELSVTGFYAKQLHIEKAYGNYLGLYELGKFMAHQMDLKLTQVVCVASCLEEHKIKKPGSSVADLVADIETILLDIE